MEKSPDPHSREPLERKAKNKLMAQRATERRLDERSPKRKTDLFRPDFACFQKKLQLHLPNRLTECWTLRYYPKTLAKRL